MESMRAQLHPQAEWTGACCVSPAWLIWLRGRRTATALPALTPYSPGLHEHTHTHTNSHTSFRTMAGIQVANHTMQCICMHVCVWRIVSGSEVDSCWGIWFWKLNCIFVGGQGAASHMLFMHWHDTKPSACCQTVKTTMMQGSLVSR